MSPTVRRPSDGAAPTFVARLPLRGTLDKFSVGRSFFGRRNWQSRLFVHTPHDAPEDDELAARGTLADYAPGYGAGGAGDRRGTVYLRDGLETVVQNPTATTHAEVTDAARCIVVCFRGEDGSERRLLLRCPTADDAKAWVQSLGRDAPVRDGPAHDMHCALSQ
jgi:hypothetical protein